MHSNGVAGDVESRSFPQNQIDSINARLLVTRNDIFGVKSQVMELDQKLNVEVDILAKLEKQLQGSMAEWSAAAKDIQSVATAVMELDAKVSGEAQFRHKVENDIQENINMWADLDAKVKEETDIRQKLEQSVQDSLSRIDSSAYAIELDTICADIKAWRDELEGERKSVKANLKQSMLSAASETFGRLSQGLQDIESEIPKIWSAVKDEGYRATQAEKFDCLDKKYRELSRAIQGLANGDIHSKSTTCTDPDQITWRDLEPSIEVESSAIANLREELMTSMASIASGVKASLGIFGEQLHVYEERSNQMQERYSGLSNTLVPMTADQATEHSEWQSFKEEFAHDEKERKNAMSIFIDMFESTRSTVNDSLERLATVEYYLQEVLPAQSQERLPALEPLEGRTSQLSPVQESVSGAESPKELPYESDFTQSPSQLADTPRAKMLRDMDAQMAHLAGKLNQLTGAMPRRSEALEARMSAVEAELAVSGGRVSEVRGKVVSCFEHLKIEEQERTKQIVSCFEHLKIEESERVKHVQMLWVAYQRSSMGLSSTVPPGLSSAGPVQKQRDASPTPRATARTTPRSDTRPLSRADRETLNAHSSPSQRRREMEDLQECTFQPNLTKSIRTSDPSRVVDLARDIEEQPRGSRSPSAGSRSHSLESLRKEPRDAPVVTRVAPKSRPKSRPASTLRRQHSSPVSGVDFSKASPAKQSPSIPTKAGSRTRTPPSRTKAPVETADFSSPKHMGLEFGVSLLDVDSAPGTKQVLSSRVKPGSGTAFDEYKREKEERLHGVWGHSNPKKAGSSSRGHSWDSPRTEPGDLPSPHQIPASAAVMVASNSKFRPVKSTSAYASGASPMRQSACFLNQERVRTNAADVDMVSPRLPSARRPASSERDSRRSYRTPYR